MHRAEWTAPVGHCEHEERTLDPIASRHRTDIEGLRGVAVLLVVLYHAGLPFARGGFIGVDVFFVLSGYLITGLLSREVEKTGRVEILRFYARRARRLIPASALMLAVTIVVSAGILAPLEQLVIARTALATSVYLSNVWFLRNTADYFAPNSETNPLLHTWSLAVEEQFYLVWPLLVVLAWRVRRDRSAVVTLLAVVSVASFVSCLWFTRSNTPIAFFTAPTRAWEFGLGGLAAVLAPSLAAVTSRWANRLGWIGLGLIVGSGVALHADLSFPGALALIPVLGTVAVLISGAVSPGHGAARVLSAQALQALGRWSYSWYLWHWPVLVLLAAVIPDPSIGDRLLGAIASLLIAVVAYRLVENPIRGNPKLLQRPKLTLALAAFATVFCVSLSVGWTLFARRTANASTQIAFTAASRDRAGLYAADCVPSHAEETLRECTFGDSTSTTTIVLFGDSHAAQWFPPLLEIASAERWRLIALVKSACPAAHVVLVVPGQAAPSRTCGPWRDAAMERIRQLRPAAVIAASSAGYVLIRSHRENWAQLSFAEWQEGSRITFRVLDSLGISTVVMRDTPRLGFDVPTCLARAEQQFWSDSESCVSSRANAIDERVFQAEVLAARGLGRISFADLTEQLCTPTLCSATVGEQIRYSDHDHLTATYARMLTPQVARFVVPVVRNATRAAARRAGSGR